MIDRAAILAEFSAKIGWEDGAKGEPLNFAGSSGIVYNSAHPLLTYENIRSHAYNFTGAGADADFEAWVRKETNKAILKVFGEYFAIMIGAKAANNVLERGEIMGGFEELTYTGSDLRIIRLDVRNPLGVSGAIEEVNFRLDGTENFSVRLLGPGIDLTQAVTATAPIKPTSWNLRIPGIYYVICDTTLPATRTWIRTHRKNYTARCQTSSGDIAAFTSSSVNSEHTLTMGVNLVISFRCDHTDILISQGDSFLSLLTAGVGMYFLKLMATNSNNRINGYEGNIEKEYLLYEIDGDSQGRAGGIRKEYEKIMKALILDSSGIDPACMPCVKKGVKYTVRGK